LEERAEKGDNLQAKIKLFFIRNFIGKTLPETKKLSIKNDIQYER